MTKIQLRRDTAANWTTNNPTPASGEPCFETDTGKFKIGDGTTTYNNLPYQGEGGGATIDDSTTATTSVWSSSKTNTEITTVANEVTQVQGDVSTLKTDVSGLKTSKQDKLIAGDNITIDPENNTISATGGGSAPTNMVTTDTDQTITGKKVFLQPNSSNKGLNVALGSNATNPDVSVHIGNASNSEFTGGMIRFDSTAPKIVGLQQQNAGGTMKISSSGDLINYASGTTEIRNGATWSTSKSGIRIPANSKSNPKVEIIGGSNTVSSSSGMDARISVGCEGAGIWATRKGVFIETSATTNAADSGAKLWLGNTNYRSAIYPVLNSTVGRCLNFETYVGDNSNAELSIQKSDVVYTDSDGVAHSLISGSGANTDLSNLSDTGKILMSEMGMPSDKYIDLTLGASGTTYTAPADGYVLLRRRYTNTNIFQELADATNYYGTIIHTSVPGYLGITLPVRKGSSFIVSYVGTVDNNATNIFRFYYAVGSSPTV